MIYHNKVKQALKEGKTQFGTFVRINDPAAIEVLAYAGLDFVIIDNEHTAMNIESMTNLIRTAEAAGIVPTVRIRQKNAADILQALDAGAMGVQIPQVDTLAEARQVARWAKYAPEGERGYAASQRAAGYGNMNPTEYARRSNEETMVVSYCETKTCVENLDEILSVDLIDVIFIGPFDLSQAYGVIGQTNHPLVQDAIDTIIKKVNAAGKAVGIIASNAEDTKRYMARGVRYFAISSDTAMISSVAKGLMASLK